MLSIRPFVAILLLALAPFTVATANATDWSKLHELVAGAPLVDGSAALPVPESGPVVVTFFASWCPPCTDEFEHLNALAGDSHPESGAIVGINLFEDFGGKKNPARMARFIARTQPQFPLVSGTEEMRVAFGDITRIPTVIVYDGSGKEIWRFIHERNATKTHVTLDELRAVLKSSKAR